ncbi:MAG: hypothetical protein WA799_08945 [Nitrosotalea sp.]
MRLKHTHAMLVFGTIFSLIAVIFYITFAISKSWSYFETGALLQVIGAILLLGARIYYPRFRHAPSRQDSSCWT